MCGYAQQLRAETKTAARPKTDPTPALPRRQGEHTEVTRLPAA